MKFRCLALLGLLIASPAVAQSPMQICSSNTTSCGLIPGQSAAAEGSHIIKAAGTMLYSLYVTTGATAGFLMTFNQTTVPGDGAVTPVDCIQVPANTTVSVTNSGEPPTMFLTGLTVVFSSTGCFTKTVSNTAFFRWKNF